MHKLYLYTKYTSNGIQTGVENPELKISKLELFCITYNFLIINFLL